MSKTKRKNILTAVFLSVILLFTTALGLTFFNAIPRARAEGGMTMLKFKQVEVGEDFAIGLTYDGELYGWSLRETGYSAGGFAPERVGMTLGEYYPNHPIKIDVAFKGYVIENNKLTKVGVTPAESSVDVSADSIKAIAATRTAAALVTQSNLLYTWGLDGKEPDKKGDDTPMNLLLRAATDTSLSGGSYRYTAGASLYQPGIVDYMCAGDASRASRSLIELLPESTDASNGAANIIDITAGENNFVVRAKFNSLNNTHFIWGESVYGQQHPTYAYDKTDTGFLLGQNENPISQLVMGGSTIAYVNAAGSLYYKGKNFYVPQAELVGATDTASGSAVNTLTLQKIVNPTTNNSRSVWTSIADPDSEELAWYRADAGIINNFEPVFVGASDPKFAPVDNSASDGPFYDSKGEPLEYKPTVAPIALGNGYGYGIADGKVYFWGNNYAGQSGKTDGAFADKSVSQPTVLYDTTRVEQVVAGKTVSGANILTGTDGEQTPGYKQLNPVSRGSAVAGTVEGTLTSKTVTLSSAYVDGKSFLSALLDKNGDVYAWGNIGGTPISMAAVDALQDYGVGNGTNRIVSVKAGYGNNLFALSSLGKIYRIYYTGTAFEVQLYDSFYTASGSTETRIANWTVNGGTNTITFSNSADKLYYNTTASSANVVADISLESAVAESEDGAYDSLLDAKNFAKTVASNLSGDAHRIILPIRQIKNGDIRVQTVDQNGNASDLPQYVDDQLTALGDTMQGGTLTNGGDLEFYWYDSTLPAAQRLGKKIPIDAVTKYFEVSVRFVYNSETPEQSSVHLIVAPRQSTQGKQILIKYWVGRYDSYLNTNLLATEEDADAYTFYDFKQTQLLVSIGNTAFSRTEFASALTDGAAKGNSTVPLLDPNNPYNNQYSIAAMNVSAGFEALSQAVADLFKSEGEESSAVQARAAAYLQSLIGEAANQDAGFPSSQKLQQSKGDLTYYNKHASTYYNDKYLFLASDHDGDIVTINDINYRGFAQWNTYFDADYAQNITVFLDLSDSLGEDTVLAQNLALLKTYFTDNNDLNGGFMYFDNRYGFSVQVREDSENGVYGLELTYQILRITAKKSMNTVLYRNNDITDPNTAWEENNNYSVYAILEEQGIAPQSGSGNDIVVNVQASLSLKADAFGSQSATEPHTYYGKPESAVNSLSAPVVELQLGSLTGGKKTFKVSDLFADPTGIKLAHEGVSTEESFAKFESTFNRNILQVDIENAQTITFYPQSATTYPFVVEFKRYAPTAEETLLYNGNASESIFVTFVVRSTRPAFKKLQSLTPSYTINDNSTIALNTRIDCASAFTMESLVNFTNFVFASDDSSVVSARLSDDKKSIALTAGVSGTAKISYTATFFDQTIYDSFTVVVATMCSMPGTVNVPDKEDVYITKLEETLKKNNASSIGQDTLALDYNKNDSADKPFYFQQTEDTAVDKPDSQKIWQNIESIGFLKSVTLSENEDYIRLIMGNFDSSTTPPIVRVVVKFVSSTNKRYEVGFKVAPSAQTLIDESGSPLQVEIIKNQNKITISNRENGEQAAADNKLTIGDIDGKSQYKVPVEFLSGLMSNYNGSKDYKIVNAKLGSVGDEKYLDVTPRDSDILLYPKYPTFSNPAGDRCAVQVSIRAEDSDEVNLITFYVKVSGIETTLTKNEYQVLFIAVFFSVLGVLLIIFIIRLAVFWKKKAEQKRIIRKNQMLIKMRDKMHNKTEAVSKEQIVRTKLKMEDPKYAKMFTEMRKDKEVETGISLDGSLVAHKAETRTKLDKAAKKKRGGKKTVEDLKAELAAKKAAFAQMQMGGTPMQDIPLGGVPLDDPMAESTYSDALSREEVDNQIKAKLAGDDILLDVEAIPEDSDNSDNQ